MARAQGCPLLELDASHEILTRVLPLANHVLFDIKHMDPKIHREMTGKDNELILSNARVVAASSARMVCRVPLIPGINDTHENLASTARFVQTLGRDIPIELLPYHRLGLWKYQALNRTYPLEGLKPPEASEMEQLRQTIENLGVRCRISK